MAAKIWLFGTTLLACALLGVVAIPGALGASPTFATAVDYGAHPAPESVSIGDLNRDGKPDLVVANFNTSDVSVLLGAGDGTFGTAVNYGAHTGPASVAIGDLNGDGKPDLAVANFNSSDVSILLG